MLPLLSVPAVKSSRSSNQKRNGENKDLSRKERRDEYEIKDAARKRSEREKRKYLDPKKHDEFKKKEAARIKEYRLKKKLAELFACNSLKETEEEQASTSSSFSSKQILNRSIKKAERLLPLLHLSQFSIYLNVPKLLRVPT